MSRILEDYRTIIVGFISSILSLLYLQYKGSIMGLVIIFIVFSSWLMLVIWNQKKTIEKSVLMFPWPKWVKASELLESSDVTYFQLKQHIINGLPVYPATNAVQTLDDSVEQLSEGDIYFELAINGELENDMKDLLFKREDIEKYVKRKST